MSFNFKNKQSTDFSNNNNETEEKLTGENTVTAKVREENGSGDSASGGRRDEGGRPEEKKKKNSRGKIFTESIDRLPIAGRGGRKLHQRRVKYESELPLSSEVGR